MLSRVADTVLLAAVLFDGAAGFTQQVSAPVPHSEVPGWATTPQIQFAQTLDVFTSIPLSIAPFGVLGSAQCDESGRMFFASFSSLVPGTQSAVFMSLSADGQRQAVYALPREVQDQPHNTDFYAASNGELHLVVVQPGIRVQWFRFDPAGKLEGEEDLPAPPDIVVRSFAVTGQGYLLLLGYRPVTTAHAAGDGKTYRAIFNSVGRLVKELAAADAGLGRDGIEQHPSEDFARADGETFYITNGHDLIEMDSVGDSLQTLLIQKPDPKDLVAGLHVSGGLAEITLLNFEPRQPGHPSFLVIGAADGEIRGLYLPPEHTSLPECFDSKQGFTFLHSDKGRLSLVRALLP